MEESKENNIYTFSITELVRTKLFTMGYTFEQRERVVKIIDCEKVGIRKGWEACVAYLVRCN